MPMTMLGLSAGLPAAFRRFCQRRLSASPPSIAASLEPVVEQPVASSASGAFQRFARMLTQRDSSSAVCGYSSLSIMFLSKHSAMSFSAWGSIHVETNVATLSRALPSSISSSWMIWYATSGAISPAGSSNRGIGPSRLNSGSTESSLVGAGWEGCLSVTVLLSWGRCDATPADERSTFIRRRMGLFDRLRRGHEPAAEPEPETPERTVVEIDASSLSRVFSAPMWLRDLGLLAW